MSLMRPNLEALIATRRSIGSFAATITIEELATDDAEITQHPVQQGASIADHAYMKPAAVTIKFMVGAQENVPLRDVYTKLLALQSSFEPLDVVTGKRIYKNMLIKSLAQTTDRDTEHVLSVTAQLQEVRIVSVETIAVPPRQRQRTPGKTGATQNGGTKQPEPVRRSILQTIGGS